MTRIGIGEVRLWSRPWAVDTAQPRETQIHPKYEGQDALPVRAALARVTLWDCLRSDAVVHPWRQRAPWLVRMTDGAVPFEDVEQSWNPAATGEDARASFD